eukprot:403332886
MNQVNFEDEDPMQDFDMITLETLSHSAIKSKFLEERQRCLVLEKDLFKSQTEGRRLMQQNKNLQDLNTLNAKNRNNTSSAFTLPSEFKSHWDELVKELILDAFPDFLDRYEELVPLVQELFIVVRMEIIQIQRDILRDVGKRMKLFDDKSDKETIENIMGYLDTKFQSIFQEYSLKVFYLSDAEIHKFVMDKYKPRCEGIISQRDGAEDDFEDNISSPDFKRFVRAVMKLSLHMVLNDPPIMLNMECWDTRQHKTVLVEKFEFWMYNKNDYYCIDGFPKEGNPCIVVLPPPYRQGYVYQGIKPAVIVLDDPTDEVVDHVRAKQEELVEKLKAKRQLSLCGLEEEENEKQNQIELQQKNQITESNSKKQQTFHSNKQGSISIQQDQINIVNFNPSKRESILQQQEETPKKQNKSSSHHISQQQIDNNDIDLSLEKLQKEIQQDSLEDNFAQEEQIIQQQSPQKSPKITQQSPILKSNQQSTIKHKSSSKNKQLSLTDVSNQINNSALLSARKILEEVSQTILQGSQTKPNQFNQYCCLSPKHLKSPLDKKNKISTQKREKSSERTNKSNSKRQTSLNKTSKISKFDITQSVLASRPGREKVQSSLLLQSKQIALQQEQQENQQQLNTQRSKESSVKSPTRSEILKTLYNDYANLKNKQSFVTLNSSQKQLFSDRKAQENNSQNQLKDEDDAILSARRRLSNNFSKVSINQVGKQNSLRNLDSRNGTNLNTGNQNSLTVSQSQVFPSSKNQNDSKITSSKLQYNNSSNLHQNNHQKNQPSIDSSKSGKSIQQDIKSQIRKLAETMKSTQQNKTSTINADKYTTSNYINQQDYQSKAETSNQPTVGFTYYQQKLNQTSASNTNNIPTSNNYINMNQGKAALNARAFEKFNKNIEMPKKVTPTITNSNYQNDISQISQYSQASAFYNKQRGYDQSNVVSNHGANKTSKVNESEVSQASTVSQMHMQKGLTDFKEDLVRKIHSYQSLLKKTENKGNTTTHNTNLHQQQQSIINHSNNMNHHKHNYNVYNAQKNQISTTYDYDNSNKFTTLDSSKSKYVINQTSRVVSHPTQAKINNYTANESENASSKTKPQNTSTNESMQKLKSVFQSKINSCHQQYEQTKLQLKANSTITSHQSNNRVSSRSKSPLQKNLPRQYVNQDGKLGTYKIIGGGNTNATVVPRKSTIQYDDLSSDSSSSDSCDFNQRQVAHQNDNLSSNSRGVLRSQNPNIISGQANTRFQQTSMAGQFDQGEQQIIQQNRKCRLQQQQR